MKARAKEIEARQRRERRNRLRALHRETVAVLQSSLWLELDPVTPKASSSRLLSQIHQMLRMIGHLLEHHGTGRTQARNRGGDIEPWGSPWACKWCLLGATKVVARTMRWSSGDLWLALNVWLFGELRLPQGLQGGVQIWDDNGIRGVAGWSRARVIERLKECR